MADIDSEKERRLVADLLEGDESAFCELYALYKDRLMWFSLKFLKSRDMAEDVFQDAFASIWQNRRFLNPNVPFGPYVYTIVKNRILNLLAGLDSTNETEDSVLDTDLNALLDKALETLSPQQKRVFDMSRKDMKSHKEIADSLGISVYTVQQHISTALKVIRAFLAKYAETYMKLLL